MPHFGTLSLATTILDFGRCVKNARCFTKLQIFQKPLYRRRRARSRQQPLPVSHARCIRRVQYVAGVAIAAALSSTLSAARLLRQSALDGLLPLSWAAAPSYPQSDKCIKIPGLSAKQAGAVFFYSSANRAAPCVLSHASSTAASTPVTAVTRPRYRYTFQCSPKYTTATSAT